VHLVFSTAKHSPPAAPLWCMHVSSHSGEACCELLYPVTLLMPVTQSCVTRNLYKSTCTRNLTVCQVFSCTRILHHMETELYSSHETCRHVTKIGRRGFVVCVVCRCFFIICTRFLTVCHQHYSACTLFTSLTVTKDLISLGPPQSVNPALSLGGRDHTIPSLTLTLTGTVAAKHATLTSLCLLIEGNQGANHRATAGTLGSPGRRKLPVPGLCPERSRYQQAVRGQRPGGRQGCLRRARQTGNPGGEGDDGGLGQSGVEGSGQRRRIAHHWVHGGDASEWRDQVEGGQQG